ncbi:MAG: hypothetical protein V3R80_04255, partial [Candidatus Tectomicrobia bacterium]
EQSGFDVVLMGLSVNDGSKFHGIPPRRKSLRTGVTLSPVTLADLLLCESTRDVALQRWRHGIL